MKEDPIKLIQSFELEIFTPPCDPGAVNFAAKAHLRVDITRVLSYLNAILQGAEYNPGAPALRWRKGAHTIVFHPLEIVASSLADRGEAAAEIGELVDLVNQTWGRRGEIDPSDAVRKRPSHLAIFKLLPGTNCKECGEPTCYNFALKLAAGLIQLDGCPRLQESAYLESKSRMAVMLGG